MYILPGMDCAVTSGCMTEDADGQIWLGSNSGISRYSRHQHLFYNYYIAGSNRSVLHWEDVLFWGNNKNLTYFNPDDIKAFTTSESVVITGLEVNNKPVEIGREVSETAAPFTSSSASFLAESFLAEVGAVQNAGT